MDMSLDRSCALSPAFLVLLLLMRLDIFYVLSSMSFFHFGVGF